MQYGKVEICGVNTSQLKLLKESEKRELLNIIKNGSPAEKKKARDKMINGNLRLVLSVIQRFTNRGENPDDLFQVGVIGLIKAIDNFNPTLDVRFSTYGVLIICSITAFTIIITGSYFQSDATSGALTTIAFGMAYGHVGAKLTAIAIAVFAWTTIIGMYYTCEKSVNYAFGDTERNKKAIPIYIIYYMLPCVIFYNIEADVLWALTDILSACYVALTIFFIYAKHKVIFALFDDFWKRFLPAKERGENPPVVSFDCALEGEGTKATK